MEFGKWRSFFWPIHRGELRKFLPMFFMFFLISFNYNALRACKDSLVVTAPQSGAEAIPFIKVWAILPGAFLLTFLFTRLANRFSREQVFYWMMALFLGFFTVFTFVLFPAQEFLHPTGMADTLQGMLPAGFKGFIAMFRNWTFTLFYVMSELWGTAILSVLFWGFANEVTNVGEAKRFYGLLMIGANIAGIFSGQASVYLSALPFLSWLPYGKCSWDQSILFLMQQAKLWLVFVVVIGLFFGSFKPAQAATLYWVGANGANASVASNWKTTNPASCGGGDSLAAPGASDAVNFDQDCDNSVVFDSGHSGSVNSVNVTSGYSGTITLARSFAVGNNGFQQSGGTFTAGSNAISVAFAFTLNGGTFNAHQQR
jgi:hypothetical protein